MEQHHQPFMTFCGNQSPTQKFTCYSRTDHPIFYQDAGEIEAPAREPDLASLTQAEREIITQVEELAYDQAGCRMIQQKLEAQNSPDFVPALVAALKSQFADVMSNQFGNYLCQKIIEVSSVSELAQIVDAVLPSAISISLSVHGTRAMQSLVEMIA